MGFAEWLMKKFVFFLFFDANLSRYILMRPNKRIINEFQIIRKSLNSYWSFFIIRILNESYTSKLTFYNYQAYQNLKNLFVRATWYTKCNNVPFATRSGKLEFHKSNIIFCASRFMKIFLKCVHFRREGKTNCN